MATNKLWLAMALVGLLTPACATPSEEEAVTSGNALSDAPPAEASQANAANDDAVVLARADAPSATLRLSTIMDDAANLALLQAGEGPQALKMKCGLVIATGNTSVSLACFDRAHDNGDSLSISVEGVPSGGLLDVSCPRGLTSHAAFFDACTPSYQLLSLSSPTLHRPADVNRDPFELALRISAAAAALKGVNVPMRDGSVGVVASVEARYGQFSVDPPLTGHGMRLTATLTDGRTVDGLDYVDFRMSGNTSGAIADVEELTTRMRLVLPH
jgi:hypothetical protein